MLLYYCFSVLWLLAHKIKESQDFNNSNHEAELKNDNVSSLILRQVGYLQVRRILFYLLLENRLSFKCPSIS